MPTSFNLSVDFVPSGGSLLVELILVVILGVVLWWCFVKLSDKSSSNTRRHEGNGTNTHRDNDFNGKISWSSLYIPMRDGVRIALDVCLPRPSEPGIQVPAVLYQTRYCRRIEFRWPLSLILKSPTERRAASFVQRGYAFIAVDVRGTGASSGTRMAEFSPDEVEDGIEITDWIVRQQWSNGSVGLFGESYSGALAVLLVARRHPAVRAAAIVKAPFDLYLDVAFPGGILWRDFNSKWSDFTRKLDRNKAIGTLGWLLLRGALPVDEDKSRKLLHAAIEQHADNYDYLAELQQITFRDDLFGGYTLASISPSSHAEDISKSGVPIYCVTGWFDLFSARSVIGLFRASRNPSSRMTIGPWPHGDLQISPGDPIRRSDYDWFSEMLQFLDEHVGGDASGVLPPECIRYWTVIENKWKTADCWPPAILQYFDYYFAAGSTLDTEPPKADSAADLFFVTANHQLQTPSRWTQDWKAYCQITTSDSAVLHFDSAVLTADLEVTGHPLMTLFVESTPPDCYFFVALLDMDEQGVRCVTEGLFRALHRKPAGESSGAPYEGLVPAHTFLRQDALPLEAGAVNEVTFDLLPVS